MNETTQPPTAPPAEPTAPPSGEHPNAPPAPAEPTAGPKIESAETAPGSETAPPPAAKRDNRMPLPPMGFEPSNFDELWRFARWGANTQFVPSAVRNRPDDVMWLLMKGRTYGLDVQASLEMYVIEGKVCLPAERMAALILNDPLMRRAGHPPRSIFLECVESTMERATWETQRRDGRRVQSIDFTIDEADRMGLLGKGRSPDAASRNQWHRQPRTMLRWRALTTLGRLVYPDLLAGLYSLEEAYDIAEVEGRQVVNMVQIPRGEEVAAAKAGGAGLATLEPLRLVQDTVEVQPDMAAAFHEVAGTPPPPMDSLFSRQPEPARSTATSRVRDRAQAVREEPRCPKCRVPVAKIGMLCEACDRDR